MSEAGSADQRPRARRRPKRRARWGLGVVVAGALWLLGGGLGWFGSPPAGAGLDQAHASEQPSIPKIHERGPHGAPAASTDTSTAVSEEEVAASAATPAADVAPPPLDPDRFESLMSRVKLHLDQEAWGRAAGVLARLEPMVRPHADARARVRRWGRELNTAVRAAESRVVTLVAAGDVLEAAEVVAALSQDGVWRPAYALAEAAALGADWSRAAAPGGLPEAAPLERRRPVRMRWEGSWRDGSVARCSDDEVTVRLTTEAGQRFPTVPRVALQPIGADGAEAVEMGLAAAHAGAPGLARLWLLRALLLGGELSTRGAALRAALAPE